MAAYLEFEKPIEDLNEQLTKTQELAKSDDKSVKTSAKELEKKLIKQIEKKTKELYANLTPWERVQVSRHPERPYTLSYIESVTDGQFQELHGDRNVGDDKAMVGGFGMLDGQSVMFIGQQKGVNTKMRQFRNFGMANPEGYRKALRLMKLAEKFNKPIVTFIDTPGAFPGLEAEERGQGEAIARNLFEMMKLTVPVVCVIIGEGASGGALGIGIGDRVLMLENTWYSVISPESCSSILWRNWEHKTDAANALKLTATDMQSNGLIDGIIPEPVGGAHAHPNDMFETVKKTLIEELKTLSSISPERRVQQRIKKFSNMGVFTTGEERAEKKTK